MRFFNEAPFVRLLLPFILGISSSVYFFQSEIPLIIGSCACIIVLIFMMLLKSHATTFKFSWINGLAVNLILFFLAAQLALNRKEIRSPFHFSNQINSHETIIAQLSEPPIEKERILKCIFKIKGITDKSGAMGSSGKLMVYLENDSLSRQLTYGDEISFVARFKEIPPPQNPGEFNYKRFLAFRSIYHQQYLKSGQWNFLSLNSGNRLMKNIYLLRNNLLNQLKNQGIQGTEYAVGAALILGYNDKLDPEIMTAYSSTGTLHVLSVSGLHVGLVYIVFNFLLGFLDRIKHGKLIKCFLIILLLWGYATLTGLSPAVLRAAAMFSFVVLGKSIHRHTTIYNTLAVSCFVLLLVNPFYIFDVGFQLSYIAVVGIVFLQPKIYNSWIPRYWLVNQIWKVTSVSIAAQLATLPLSIYYFQQFPNYFLISNLLVIPLSTVIIYNGIMVFALGAIPFIGPWLGKLLNWLLCLLNGSVRFMEHLPYAQLQGISISFVEMILLYGLIISGVIYLLKINYTALISSFALTVIILLLNLAEGIVQHRQQKLVVYNISHTSAMNIIYGNNTSFISDTALANNKGKMQYFIGHYLSDSGIHSSELIKQNSNCLQLSGGRVFRLSDKGQLQSPLPESIHYLILSGNCDVKIAELTSLHHFNLIIIDSGNSKTRIKRWMEECRQLNQSVFNVVDQGAFVEDI